MYAIHGIYVNTLKDGTTLSAGDQGLITFNANECYDGKRHVIQNNLITVVVFRIINWTRLARGIDHENLYHELYVSRVLAKLLCTTYTDIMNNYDQLRTCIVKLFQPSSSSVLAQSVALFGCPWRSSDSSLPYVKKWRLCTLVCLSIRLV